MILSKSVSRYPFTKVRRSGFVLNHKIGDSDRILEQVLVWYFDKGLVLEYKWSDIYLFSIFYFTRIGCFY